MQALLGIDLGTTGVKAALFATEDGHVISSAFVDYPLVHPHPGWAEQDPEQWWQATITAIRSCLLKAQNMELCRAMYVALDFQVRCMVLFCSMRNTRYCDHVLSGQTSEAMPNVGG